MLALVPLLIVYWLFVGQNWGTYAVAVMLHAILKHR